MDCSWLRIVWSFPWTKCFVFISFSLVVVSRFQPSPIVMALLPRLAPSRPFVVYCQYKEVTCHTRKALKSSWIIFCYMLSLSLRPLLSSFVWRGGWGWGARSPSPAWSCIFVQGVDKVIIDDSRSGPLCEGQCDSITSKRWSSSWKHEKKHWKWLFADVGKFLRAAFSHAVILSVVFTRSKCNFWHLRDELVWNYSSDGTTERLAGYLEPAEDFGHSKLVSLGVSPPLYLVFVITACVI